MMYFFRHYPITFVIVVAICYLSFFTPPQTQLSEISFFDKIAHTCMYGGLCLIMWIEYLRSHSTINSAKLWIGSFVIPILFSGIIELLQQYATDNRSGEWLDLAANSLGVSLAALIGYFILRPLIQKK